MRLTFREFELPLRHVFTISRSSTRTIRTLIVELEHDGLRGFGEAGEDEFYGASIAKMKESLEAVRPLIESRPPCEPAELWAELAPKFGGNTFAQCALDQAVWDLWGKVQGSPVWRLWGLDASRLPVTDYTIGIDQVDVMVGKMEEFPGWPVYKIKLGTPQDLEIVGRLRHHSDAVFRVDANCAWTADEALRNARALKLLGVEFIEQPLPREDWDGMRRLFHESALPIIADESCQTEPDVDRCAECFHGVNVKLVKCGGLTPAKRMIDHARSLGLRTMVGCMVESTVSISANAQLLPLLDYADIDGALLLGEDIASGVRIDAGRVILPEENGCGVRLLR